MLPLSGPESTVNPVSKRRMFKVAHPIHSSFADRVSSGPIFELPTNEEAVGYSGRCTCCSYKTKLVVGHLGAVVPFFSASVVLP